MDTQGFTLFIACLLFALLNIFVNMKSHNNWLTWLALTLMFAGMAGAAYILVISLIAYTV